MYSLSFSLPELLPADEAVSCFVDRLSELPLDDWLDIGRSLQTTSPSADRATALALLEAIIAINHLDVAAWNVCDALETSAFLASRGPGRWTSADRRAFSAAHLAAEVAALALLARDGLPPRDFAALVAPFAAPSRMIPFTRLLCSFGDLS